MGPLTVRRLYPKSIRKILYIHNEFSLFTNDKKNFLGIVLYTLLADLRPKGVELYLPCAHLGQQKQEEESKCLQNYLFTSKTQFF